MSRILRCEEIVLKDIPPEFVKILDFGCGNGVFTASLQNHSRKLYGCDINLKNISEAKIKHKNIFFTTIKPHNKTPYKNNFFDCVTMMGVLEHVADERKTLVEINRILKKKGILYIYGLNKGFFGFLDSGNIKFRFPLVHKLLYYFFYNRKKYREEFIYKNSQGIFGDFTLEKKWHSHYSKDDLKKLTKNYYVLTKLWRYSFFLPILLVIRFIFSSIFKKNNKIIDRLVFWDQKLEFGPFSYSFVAKCIKK